MTIENKRFGYSLLDAEIRNKEYPDTFKIPALSKRLNINVGEVVQLCFEWNDEKPSERMWVEVTRKNNDEFSYTGKLCNRPLNNQYIDYDSIVFFNAKNILKIS